MTKVINVYSPIGRIPNQKDFEYTPLNIDNVNESLISRTECVNTEMKLIRLYSLKTCFRCSYKRS